MMQQQQQQQRFFSQQEQPNDKYKVTLCQFFQKDGHCEKGETCNYAHGENELKGKYKTILCKLVIN